MSGLVEEPMTELQEVPGKGQGLIATRKIPKGTRILSEKAIIRVPEIFANIAAVSASIGRQVDSLPPDQREAFLSMCNIYPSDDDTSPYLGIVRSNGLPMDFGSGVFLQASRINHACDNNAQKDYNEGIKRHTVHALRDIEEGEEITITYLGILKNRRTRQQALRTKFMFTCTCNLCSLPDDLSAESDRRLDEILALEDRIARAGITGMLSNPKRMLGHVYQQVQLYKEHSLDDIGLPRAFFDAAQIVVTHGDLARARVFTERAAAAWRLIRGDDDPHVIKTQKLALDPSTHTTYGHTAQWKTAFDQVPQGLNRDDFEAWLWKREKLPEVGAFRNQDMFPIFLGLPSDNVMERDFFKIKDGRNFRPRRHWCFLAEIVEHSDSSRLQMTVKDVTGKTLPIIFYTGTHESEVVASQIREGYTVAVLYAEQHAFVYEEVGIRFEKPTLLKIFPVALDDLLSLSDRVHKYSTVTNGMRTCHGCGKQGASLKKCAKCSMFWYCNGACQKAGWAEKDHKEDCTLLQDGDLKGLLSLNEGKFESRVKFPMTTGVS
ncbi:unnamed protein product [Fusarium graminearum]|nr:unnamed protein product [Fusarium graminearum]